MEVNHKMVFKKIRKMHDYYINNISTTNELFIDNKLKRNNIIIILTYFFTPSGKTNNSNLSGAFI